MFLVQPSLRNHPPVGALVACAVAFAYPLLAAADTPPVSPPAVVAHVKLLTDKVDDLSSLGAWRQAVIQPGMKDQDKVLAAFDACLKYHHHDLTPNEYLGLPNASCTDAIKLFNVYGYCTGSGAHTAYLQLLRQMGIEARAWSVYKWGVVEAHYDGGWHYLDPGMLCYFLKPDGSIASVDDIVQGLKTWYAANPGFLNEDKKIRDYMKDPGIAKGPEILRNCPTFDKNGAYPLNFFGWYTTMLVFNGMNKTPFLYEEPHTQGHEMNLTLHRGELITRYWNAEHLPTDWFKEKPPECLKAVPGKGVLYYTPKYGDLGNGRVGSGEVSYTVPLDATLPAAALIADNLAYRWPGPQKEIRSGIGIQNAAHAAVLAFERSTGYLYAAAHIECTTQIADGGAIAVQVSLDNGRSWQAAGQFGAGPSQRIDLSSLVARHYRYRLKLTLTGAQTGLADLKISEQFQCSQRALPALGKGANKLSFSVGPQEGTVTVEGTSPKFKDRNPTWEELGVRFEGIDATEAAKNGAIVARQGKVSSITVPIETPGDLKRLRFGGQFRAGDKAEGWDYQVSFDGGKSWNTVGRAAGPVRNSSHYIATEAIPAGSRQCLVRYQGDSQGNLVLFNFRVDADYALAGSGFVPVKMTYAYQEAGKPVTQAFTAKSAAETFNLSCGEQPVLTSIRLELAP